MNGYGAKIDPVVFAIFPKVLEKWTVRRSSFNAGLTPILLLLIPPDLLSVFGFLLATAL